MILPIVKYGDPVLQIEGEEVTDIDGQLAKFVENMFETMYEAKGVGLAGPQVVETKGKVVSEEGCLSFPGVYFEVERPEVVTVSAIDIDGKEFTFEVSGLAARCVLHETDHINGKLFIEFLSPLKRDLLKRKIKKKIKLGEWE